MIYALFILYRALKIVHVSRMCVNKILAIIV